MCFTAKKAMFLLFFLIIMTNSVLLSADYAGIHLTLSELVRGVPAQSTVPPMLSVTPGERRASSAGGSSHPHTDARYFC